MFAQKIGMLQSAVSFVFAKTSPNTALAKQRAGAMRSTAGGPGMKNTVTNITAWPHSPKNIQDDIGELHNAAGSSVSEYSGMMTARLSLTGTPSTSSRDTRIKSTRATQGHTEIRKELQAATLERSKAACCNLAASFMRFSRLEERADFDFDCLEEGIWRMILKTSSVIFFG
ncbi:unnamed protein product [Polarella glacialis]|uniref:Uncharacterized protein n=1 Tax=Polarella glacialis TaxID=89957 RepID=A0A813DIQ9_POLGL|nr:unnamed protein product [Polarella glacialis]